MGSLKGVLDYLRPFVHGTDSWDYCIVWKFGDDPSRYIEWMGCCCSGSEGVCENAKEKIVSAKQHLVKLCKDGYVQHSVRTKSCERLAQFPSSLPLYSGVHGEVAMTSQPRWLNHESIGTQVLIPIFCGLIELFCAKQVPRDQNMIDSIISECDMFVELDYPREIFLEEDLKFKKECIPYTQNFPPPMIRFIPPLPHPHPVINQGFEGSSTGSNPSVKSGSGYVSPSQSIGKSVDMLGYAKSIVWSDYVSPSQSIGKSVDILGYANSVVGSDYISPNPSFGKSMDRLGYANSVVEGEKLKPKQKTGKEQYHSKNLIVERNRRNRIKDGLFTLRALVPNISKMDRASILSDAVVYIKELQKNVEELEHELRKLEEEENLGNNAEKLSPEPQKECEATRHSQIIVNKPLTAQMEVHKIGSRDFLLKFLCNHNRGVFVRLLEAINSLGLQVVDVNVTTCNGMFLNILTLVANGKEFEAGNLKDLLLTSWSSQTVDGTTKKRKCRENT